MIRFVQGWRKIWQKFLFDDKPANDNTKTPQPKLTVIEGGKHASF